MNHFSKIPNFLEFSVVFYQHTKVKFAQTQKIDIFWITQSLVYLEPFLHYQSGDFWQFRGDFGKKNDFKKKFFLKSFFFCRNRHEIAKNRQKSPDW